MKLLEKLTKTSTTFLYTDKENTFEILNIVQLITKKLTFSQFMSEDFVDVKPLYKFFSQFSTVSKNSSIFKEILGKTEHLAVLMNFKFLHECHIQQLIFFVFKLLKIVRFDKVLPIVEKVNKTKSGTGMFQNLSKNNQSLLNSIGKRPLFELNYSISFSFV